MCRSARTLADARHARIRRLAPCLRRHLPGDGWFEFVRRIHRRIAENPWIPSGKNGLSNACLSVSPTKERSSVVLPRSSLFLARLAYRSTPGTNVNRNVHREPRALTFDCVSHIWESLYVSNLRFALSMRNVKLPRDGRYELPSIKLSFHTFSTKLISTCVFFEIAVSHPDYLTQFLPFVTSQFAHGAGRAIRPKVSLHLTDSVSDDLSLSAVNSENQLPTFTLRPTRFWIQFYTALRVDTRPRER